MKLSICYSFQFGKRINLKLQDCDYLNAEMFTSNLMPARITKDFPEKTLTITNLDPTSKKCWTIWWKKILFLEPHYFKKNACTLHICTERILIHIASTIETQMNVVLFLLFGRLGHQGNTKNFCKLVSYSRFEDFFSYFHGQNKYKITVSLYLRVSTKILF